jgi:uncharacterized protein YceK
MHTYSMKMLARTLCLGLVLTGSGCGTMVSHFGVCGSTPAPGVYRGTVFDGACIAAPFSHDHDSQSFGILPLGVVDLPFSLAADTIIFPFDLADYVARTKSDDEKALQPNPQGRANGKQPFSSETNRTSAAAASRRSP